MADGGEGTVESMVEATEGHYHFIDVTGPLGTPVQARWGMLGDGKTAVIEMAAASGLHHVPPEHRNPLLTTSYGTGELILAALDRGVEHIILGIGGSATNDGGAGMLQALGIDLLDEKGALDGALAVYGKRLQEFTGRDVMNAPGAGAAGGMGAALLGLLGADLKPGVEIVINALQLERLVADASLVITGEGRLDSQSICGKTPIGVARCAKRYQKPVIALAGGLTLDHQIVHEHGLDAVFSVLTRIATLPEALEDAEYNLRISARNIASVWKLSQQQIH